MDSESADLNNPANAGIEYSIAVVEQGWYFWIFSLNEDTFDQNSHFIHSASAHVNTSLLC